MIDDSLTLDIDTGEDPVQWLLDTFKSNWPGSEFPQAVHRIHRNDSKNIDTGERSRSVELDKGYVPVGVAHVDTNDAPMGLNYDFDVETILSVRVRGLHESEHGAVASDSAFGTLIDGLQEATKRERKHPDIDGGEIYYHTLYPAENETDMSGDNRDLYHRQWEVRIEGDEYRDD